MGAGQVYDTAGGSLLYREVAVLSLVEYLLAVFGAFLVIRTAVWSTKLHIKPFVCGICMGYWLGMAFAFYFFKDCNFFNSQIYACLSAGSNAILNKYVNGEN